jgi:hypothetical protein
MKVVVSWSGEASHDVAKALKDWLPVVIEAVDVFPVVAETGPRAHHG